MNINFFSCVIRDSRQVNSETKKQPNFKFQVSLPRNVVKADYLVTKTWIIVARGLVSEFIDTKVNNFGPEQIRAREFRIAHFASR